MSDVVAEAVDTVPSVLKTVSISQIRENKTALRPVDRTGTDYKELLESVKRSGVLNTICVRECKDTETGTMYYGLIDGLHRFTAAKDAGLDKIDVKIVQASDFDVLEKQFILNIHHVVTQPAEYSKQLARMLSMNQALTVDELANRLGKSTSFVYERLSLTELKDSISKLVDQQKIPLVNAFSLAKLPQDEQDAFVDRAMMQAPLEFCPQVSNRIKQLKEAKRKGKDAGAEVFKPNPHLRKVEEIKREYETPTILKDLLSRNSITDANEAAKFAVRWVLNMDPDAVTAAKAKNEARTKEAADAKARREQEKLERAEKNALNKSLGVAA